MAFTSSIRLLAVGFGVVMSGSSLAQVPGATVGLPADITDLGSTPPSRGQSATNGITNPGGLSFGSGSRSTTNGGAAQGAGVDPGGLSVGGRTSAAGTVLGATGRGVNPSRSGVGTGGGGAGGAGIGGAAARPTQNDDYLNPLYGRGLR